MKVRELKEVLAGVSDEAEVVTRGSDHSYYTVLIAKEKAEITKAGLYEPDDPKQEGLIDVLVLW